MYAHWCAISSIAYLKNVRIFELVIALAACVEVPVCRVGGALVHVQEERRVQTVQFSKVLLVESRLARHQQPLTILPT